MCPLIAPRIDRTSTAEVLDALLAGSPADAIAARTFARELPDKVLGAAVAVLDDDRLLRLVEIIEGPDALPRDREIALAQVATERTHPVLQAWAGRMLAVMPDAPPPPPRSAARMLDEVEHHKIATCPDSELARALATSIEAPVSGLVPALAGRAEIPNVVACAALLGCGDPPERVARELDRFADVTPQFATRLDTLVVEAWNQRFDLPVLAHARLYRWEAHLEAVVDWLDANGGALAAVMFANALPGRLATETLWRGLAECVMFWRYRDRPRLVREGTNRSRPLLRVACRSTDRASRGPHRGRARRGGRGRALHGARYRPRSRR